MLRELGYIESSRSKRPCRPDGSPLPWMNYHVIAFLEERLNKNLSLFEYGSGTSTSFYASLVNDVVSVETDPDWYAEVRKTIPENVELKFIDMKAGGRYADLAANENRKFDVGSERTGVKFSVPALELEANCGRLARCPRDS